MESDDIKKYAAIGALAVVLVGAGWFLWKRSSVPEPTPGPGQSLHNPFGTTAPPGPGARSSPTPQPAVAPAAGQQGYGGMNADSTAAGTAAPPPPQVPRAGTYDPRVGFGPSAGGPFRRR